MDQPLLPDVERVPTPPDADRALLQILDGLAALRELSEAGQLRESLHAAESGRGRLRIVRDALGVLEECERLLRTRGTTR